MNIKNFPKTRLVFLLLFLLELVSFFCYLFPIFGKVAFFIILIASLFLTFKDLKFGLLLIFIELIIGSKGYLFHIDFFGVDVSIRIVLWIIVMSFWFAKLVNELLIHKYDFKKINSLKFLYSKHSKYFLVFFLFILWGIVSGVLHNNYFDNLFFDFNGWIFFLLVFPIYSSIQKIDDVREFLKIGLIAIVWVCAKTFILLFLFSHNIYGIIYEIYRWVRVTGVGEITQVQGGFYRIFLQSHIFVLITYFVFLFLISQVKNIKELFTEKTNLINFIIITLLSSVVLLSFSRSFWVAGAIGFLISLFVIFIKYDYKRLLKLLFVLILSGALALLLIFVVVKFPYPDPIGGFDPARLIGERAIQVKDEAAVSSRWNLLPVLLGEIKSSIFLGKGFGSTVTYKSNDPRVLESTVSGEYTTYAFEWGWLDIWLKLGLFGLASYLLLLFKIVTRKIVNNQELFLIYGLNLGIVIVAFVSIFTPYTNHPLGIGYIIFAVLFLDIINNKAIA